MNFKQFLKENLSAPWVVYSYGQGIVRGDHDRYEFYTSENIEINLFKDEQGVVNFAKEYFDIDADLRTINELEARLESEDIDLYINLFIGQIAVK